MDFVCQAFEKLEFSPIFSKHIIESPHAPERFGDKQRSQITFDDLDHCIKQWKGSRKPSKGKGGGGQEMLSFDLGIKIMRVRTYQHFLSVY